MPIFSRFMQSFSRSIRDMNGEKNISLLMIFFTVSFSRFTPSRVTSVGKTERRVPQNSSIEPPRRCYQKVRPNPKRFYRTPVWPRKGGFKRIRNPPFSRCPFRTFPLNFPYGIAVDEEGNRAFCRQTPPATPPNLGFQIRLTL